MWRVAFILFVLFMYSAFADDECVSVDEITKCVRLPIGNMTRWLFNSGSYTENSWNFIYDDVRYSGNYASVDGWTLTCGVTEPFVGTFTADIGPLEYETAYATCAHYGDMDMLWGAIVTSKLDGDVCPDDFATVSYDFLCDDGYVYVTDIPYCDSDTSGDFCLIEVPVAPCAAGVTTLRTGTGVVVSLWAEKSTQPSLCVKYNDMVCYANLELGQATNSININYNNLIYHTVD